MPVVEETSFLMIKEKRKNSRLQILSLNEKVFGHISLSSGLHLYGFI